MDGMPKDTDKPDVAPRGLPTGSFDEWVEWSTGKETVKRGAVMKRAADAKDGAPAAGAARPRAFGVSLLIVTALILVAQVVAYSVHPVAPQTPDSTEYLARAWSIAHGGGLVDPRRTPGYPLFLDAIFAVAGWGNLGAVVAAQTALSVLTVYMIYLLGWRLARRVWLASAIAGLCALNLYMINWQFIVRDETYSTFLTVLLFLLVERLLAPAADSRSAGWRWLEWGGFVIVSIAMILTRLMFIYLPALLLVGIAALALWRRRARWRGVVGALAVSGALIYACILGYMALNGLINGYFGVSYIGSVNMFGRIILHQQSDLSVSPQFQAEQRNLIAFERAGDGSPWDFAARYGYTSHDYAAISAYTIDLLKRHPLSYALASLSDLRDIWLSKPLIYAPGRAATVFSALREVGRGSLLSYDLLPLLLVWLGWRLWRNRDNHALHVLALVTLALLGTVVVLSVAAFNEYYRLRSPLDELYLLTVALTLWDVARMFAPRVWRLVYRMSPAQSAFPIKNVRGSGGIDSLLTPKGLENG